ncbi:MAG: hypothetical protein V4596_10120 [Bdellovibrionota bacterium]
MGFIRVLIPTWRFFDRLGRVPELFYRLKVSGKFGPWLPALEKPTRKFYHLFLNPEGNLHLAYNTLVDRLLDDSQNKSINFENQISFLQIKNLVHQKALTSATKETTHFEFKVSVTQYEKSTPYVIEVFKTPEYKV